MLADLETPTFEAASLEATWLKLMARLNIDHSQARPAFADIARRYGSEPRVYHTLAHIRQVLDDVDRLAPFASKLAEVQLAAWLHDAVYDPRAADNEEQSAAYATQLLGQLGQPQALIAEVQRLILLTRHHETSADDGNAHVLLDADLAILGAAPAAYAQYAAKIRLEYAWVSNTAYTTGRMTVLKRFLQRPFIYYTAPMRRAREDMARLNMQQEIDSLSRRSY